MGNTTAKFIENSKKVLSIISLFAFLFSSMSWTTLALAEEITNEETPSEETPTPEEEPAPEPVEETPAEPEPETIPEPEDDAQLEISDDELQMEEEASPETESSEENVSPEEPEELQISDDELQVEEETEEAPAEEEPDSETETTPESEEEAPIEETSFEEETETVGTEEEGNEEASTEESEEAVEEEFPAEEETSPETETLVEEDTTSSETEEEEESTVQTEETIETEDLPSESEEETSESTEEVTEEIIEEETPTPIIEEETDEEDVGQETEESFVEEDSSAQETSGDSSKESSEEEMEEENSDEDAYNSEEESKKKKSDDKKEQEKPKKVEVVLKEQIKKAEVEFEGIPTEVQIQKGKPVELKENKKKILVGELQDIAYRSIDFPEGKNKEKTGKNKVKVREVYDLQSDDILEVTLEKLEKEDLELVLDSEVVDGVISDSGVNVTLQNDEAGTEIETNLDVEIRMEWDDVNDDGIVDGTSLQESDIVPAYYDESEGVLKSDGITVINKNDDQNFIIFSSDHLTTFVISDFQWVSGSEPSGPPAADAYIEAGDISKDRVLANGMEAMMILNITNEYTYGMVRKINSITVNDNGSGSYMVDHVRIFQDSNENGSFDFGIDDELTYDGITNNMAAGGTLTLSVDGGHLTNTSPNTIGVGQTTSFFIVYEYSGAAEGDTLDTKILMGEVELIDDDGYKVNNDATLNPTGFSTVDDTPPMITSFTAPTAAGWPAKTEYVNDDYYIVRGTYTADIEDTVTFTAYHDGDNDGYYTMGGSDIYLGEVTKTSGVTSGSFSIDANIALVSDPEVRIIVYAEDDIGNSNMSEPLSANNFFFPTKDSNGDNNVSTSIADRVLIARDVTNPSISHVWTTDSEGGVSDGILDGIVVVYDDNYGIDASTIHMSDIFISGATVTEVEYTETDGLVDWGDIDGDGTLDGPMVTYRFSGGNFATDATPTVHIPNAVVSDAAGNPLTSSWDAGSPARDGAGPVITDGKTLDIDGNGTLDGIVATFSEDVKASSLSNADFALSGAVTVTPTSATEVEPGVVLLQFTSSALDNTDANAITIIVDAEDIQDTLNNGNEGTADFSGTTDGAVIAPQAGTAFTDSVINEDNIDNLTLRIQTPSGVDADGSEGDWSNLTANIKLTNISSGAFVTYSENLSGITASSYIDVSGIDASALGDGNIQIEVQFVDDHGNETVISTSPLEYGYKVFGTVLKDTLAPDIHINPGVDEVPNPTSDSTPPFTLTITNPGTTNTLYITGTSESGTECYLNDASTGVTELTILENEIAADGTIDLELFIPASVINPETFSSCELTLIDDNGNVSNGGVPWTINTFLFDPQLPEGVVVTSPADGTTVYTKNSTYLVEGIFTPDTGLVTVKYYRDTSTARDCSSYGTTPVKTETGVDGSAGVFSNSLTLSQNASNYFCVTVTDESGNESDPGASGEIVHDNTPPVLELNSAFTPNPQPNPSNLDIGQATYPNHPDFSFIAKEKNDIVSVQFAGACNTEDLSLPATIGNTTTGVPFTIELDSDGAGSPLLDGIYNTCALIAEDNAGNTSNLLYVPSFEIDTDIPLIDWVNETSDTLSIRTNDQTPEALLDFTSDEAGTAVLTGTDCYLDNDTINPGENTLTFVSSTGGNLGTGSYSCTVEVEDSAGNMSNALVFEFVIDTTAPTIAWDPTTLFDSRIYTNDQTPEYDFTVGAFDAGETEMTVILSGAGCYTSVGTVTASGSHVLPFSDFSGGNLGEGIYLCDLQLQDEAGNMSNTITTDFEVDVTKPNVFEEIPVESPTNDPYPAYTFFPTDSQSPTVDAHLAGSCFFWDGSTASQTLSDLNKNQNVTVEFSETGGAPMEGLYDDCVLTVEDLAGNISNPLNINKDGPFIVDTSDPTITVVNDFETRINETNPEFTFSVDEEVVIQVTGDCGSNRDNDMIAADTDVTITLDDGLGGPLTESGTTYYQCTLEVTDMAANVVEYILPDDANGFQVDLTAPVGVTVTDPITPITINATTKTIAGDFTLDSVDLENITSGSYTFELYKDPDNDNHFGVSDIPVATFTATTISGTGTGTFEFADVPLTVEADNNFVVNAIDDLGNQLVDPIDVPTITQDNTNPVLTVITEVPSPTQDTTPQFEFSSDSDGTIAISGPCALDPAETEVTAYVPHTIALYHLTAGDPFPSDFVVNPGECVLTFTDEAGNTSNLGVNPDSSDQSLSEGFIIDNTEPQIIHIPGTGTAPDIFTDINGGFITNNPNPTFSFSSNEIGIVDVTGSCRSDFDTYVLESGDLASFTITLMDPDVSNTSGELDDGVYNDCVLTVEDLAGNISSTIFNAGLSSSTSTIPSFEVDTMRPLLSPDVLVPNPSPSNPNPEYSFYSSEDATLSRVEGDCVIATGTAVVDQASGINTIQITGDSGPDGIPNTADDIALVDGNTYSNCTIYAEDAAGNESTGLIINPFTIDDSAPAGAIITDPPAAGITVNADTYVIHGEFGAEIVDVSVTAHPLGNIDENNPIASHLVLAGDTSFHLEVPLTQDALNEFEIRIKDALGNYKDLVVPVIIEDSISPAVEVTDLYADDGTGAYITPITGPVWVTDETSPRIVGTADDTVSGTAAVSSEISEVVVTIDGQSYIATVTDNTDPTNIEWEIPGGTIDPPLQERDYDITVEAYDSAQVDGPNRGAKIYSNTNDPADGLTIDMPPVITVDALTTNDRTPALTGTVTDADLSTVEITVDVNGTTYTSTAGEVVIDEVNETWELLNNAITPNLADGVYEVIATATQAPHAAVIDTTNDELTIDGAPLVEITSINTQAFSGTTITSSDSKPGIFGTFTDPDPLIWYVMIKDETNTTTLESFQGNLNAGDSTWAIDVAEYSNDLADGFYNVWVMITDTGFNTGSYNNAALYELEVNTNPDVLSASIWSDNANPEWAKDGDTITLQFITNEEIDPATVQVNFTSSTARDSGVGTNLEGVTVTNTTGNVWTAEFTVDDGTIDPDGLTTFAVNFDDLSGNSTTLTTVVGNTSSVTIDNTPEDVVITTSETSPTNADPIPITVTFSDAIDPTNFDANDITVSIDGTPTTGLLSNMTGGPDIFEFDLDTTTLSGNDVSISLEMTNNKVTDLAGNGNNATANSLDITFDNVSPDVVISSTDVMNGGTTNTTPIPVTFTFSEEISAFVMGDISLTGNGSVTSLTQSGTDPKIYAAEITPTDPLVNASFNISLPANTVTDLAENGNTLSTPNPFSFDYIVEGPMIVINSPGANSTVNSNTDVEIEVTAGDEDVTNIRCTVIEDAAGTDPAPSVWTNPCTTAFDTPPTATNSETDTRQLNITEFLDLAEGAVFDFVVEATDAQGNVTEVRRTFTKDTQGPDTITISLDSGAATTAKNPIPATIDFGEEIDYTTFDISDFDLTGITSNIDSVDFKDGIAPTANAQVFNLEVVPDSAATIPATIILQLKANSVTDIAGNENSSTASDDIEYDNGGPIITIDDGNTPAEGSNVLPTDTVVFDVTANLNPIDYVRCTVAPGDLTTPPSPASWATPCTINITGDTYTATFQDIPAYNSASDGDITFFIEAFDTNTPTANSTVVYRNFVKDTTPPTVTVNTLTTNDDTPEITGTISDTISSIDVTVDGNTYTATNNTDGTWTLPDNTISSLADGIYDVSVDATNAFGTSSDSTTDELSIITSLTISIDTLSTSDTTPEITGTVSDPSASIEVIINGNSYAATNNTDGTWTLADDTISPALTDGIYDIVAIATDAVPNTAIDSTTNELTINASAPTVTVDTLTTNDNTPEITGTVSDSTATIDVTINGNTYTATNNTDGAWTLTDNTITPALTDGTYDVSVDATNGFGTGSDTTTDELTIITSLTVTIDSLTTSDTTPEITGTISDPAATIQLIVNGNSYAATNNTDGTWTLPDNTITPDLTNGTYDIVAIATDPLTNSANDSTTDELTINAVAPSITVNTLTTNDTSPALTGTVDDPSASISVTVDGNTYAATNNTDGTWTLTDNTITPALADGTYDISVDATNGFGTGSDTTTDELTIITTLTVTIDSLTTSDTTPELTGTINIPTANIVVILEGNSYTATNNTDGTWTLADNTISPTLADGTYEIVAIASDSLGNTGIDSTTYELTINASAPTVTIDTLTTNDTSPALTGTVDDPSASISVTVDGNTYTATNNTDGTWTLTDNTITPALTDGTYDISVDATNSFGTGSDTTTDELIIITTLTVTIDSLTTSDTTPEITGTISDPSATIQVIVSGNSYTATNNTDGTWTLPDNTITPDLTNGTYEIVAIATDPLTNSANDSTTDELTINAVAPSVTVNTLTTNDTTPEITGTVNDPTATIDVTVNGNTYTATNNTDGTWTLTDNTITPALTDGTYDVSVDATNGFGTGSDTTTDELTIITSLTVTIDSLTTSDTTPEITGTISDPSATIQVIVSGNSYTATNNTDGTWTLPDNTITPDLTNGTYDIVAIATDSLGNITYDSSTNELTINTVTPLVTVDALTTNDTTPTLTGTVDDPSASISVTVDGNTYAATNNTDGTWTLADNTISPALADGTYDVSVDATNTVGTGSDSTVDELIITSTPIPLTVTANDLTTSDITPEISGTYTGTPTTLNVTITDATTAMVFGPAAATFSGGTWSLDVTSALTPGETYTITAEADDGTTTDTDTASLVITSTPAGTNATVILSPGWNVFSTPKALSDISWSANGNSNMSFYKVENGSISGTTTAVNTANVVPLEGFFVNNTSGSNIELYLTFSTTASTPRTFPTANQWYLVGAANTTPNDGSDYTEIEIGSALSTFTGYSALADYTDDFTGGDNSTAIDYVGSPYQTSASNIVGKYFEEFKAYAIYVTDNSQTLDPFVPTP